MDEELQPFLDQANRTAESEALRQQPLFALLTGSAAWGPVSSRSDIDIIFISAEHDVVSYRYYMPEVTGVAIRTEVGRIPVSYLERVLSSGYADEISTGLREQIKNARVLSGDRQAAERMIARFSSLEPKKKLLGEYLFQAKEALARANEALASGDRIEALRALDILAKNIWRLVLVARHKVGVQKDKHEVKAARAALAETELAEYQASRRISGIDRKAALLTLRASGQVISEVFGRAGIDVSIVGDVEDRTKET